MNKKKGFMIFVFSVLLLLIIGCDDKDGKEYYYPQNFNTNGGGDIVNEPTIITGREMIATIIYPEYETINGDIIINIPVNYPDEAIVLITFKDDGTSVPQGIEVEVSSSDGSLHIDGICVTGGDGKISINLGSKDAGVIFIKGWFLEFPEENALEFYVEYE